MSKNKLSWSIALFLIAITSLPIAYAQAFTGTRIFFVLVNAAVIGLVLFILQAFLIQQKQGKEKGVVLFVVVAASLVLAFLFGQNGLIWNTGPLSRFFNIYVFVNAVIIAIVAYFVFGLFKVNEKLAKSPQGQTGYGILIFIGALIWAVGIQSAYGDIFIWEAYKSVVSFFIGSDGILNPNPPNYRLLVLLGSFFLFSFFFNQFLIKGGMGQNQMVNYGLAAIMAINLASAGVKPKAIIIIAEMLFVLMMATALKDTITSTKHPGVAAAFRWFLSIVLIGWASSAATYGTEFQGILAWIVGTIWSIFGGGISLVSGASLIDVILFIIFMIVGPIIVIPIIARLIGGRGGTP